LGLAAAGFEAAFFVVFFAAVLALEVAEVPVTAFLAGARFAVVVFLVAVEALGLAITFFAATTFFVAGALVAALVDLAVVVDFLAGALVAAFDLVVVALVVLDFVVALVAAALLAGFFVVLEAEVLEGGFAFSLEASGLVLGASLTRPEGPLGSTKMFFSVPEERARESWVF